MSINDMDKAQRKRLLFYSVLVLLVSIVFISIAMLSLRHDRISMSEAWKENTELKPEIKAEIDRRKVGGTEVITGTYLENIKHINLAESNYEITMLIWFRYDGDKDLDMTNNFRFYKGMIDEMHVVKTMHENGAHYESVRVYATISKNFQTRRFPLDSHQLRLYLECDYPVEEVYLTPDYENSGINDSLSINGYTIKNSFITEYGMIYSSTHNDPSIDKTEAVSEILSGLEIHRSGWGLYFKCFIALFGTTLWVLITLYVATRHHVDMLDMMPDAFFGSVANIMIGASLLPDALTFGLLEYINIWGIYSILIISVIIIAINRIRSISGNEEDAELFGQIMLIEISITTVLGHILIPLSAIG